MAGRKIVTTYTKTPKTVAIWGDSIYDGHGTWGVRGAYMGAAVLMTKLKALGANCILRNFAYSGWTTTQMLATQAQTLGWYDYATLYIIAGGSNDQSAVSGSGATTTSLPLTAGTGTKFAVAQQILVAVPTGGDVNGNAVTTITAIATDTLTVSPALPSAPIANAFVWFGPSTQSNLQLLGQNIFTAHANAGKPVPLVLYVSTQYQNNPGFDTPTVPWPLYARIRPYQAAAATVEEGLHPGYVAYWDMWQWMANMVSNTPAGNNVQGNVLVPPTSFPYVPTYHSYTIAPGDSIWHATSSTQHLSAAGHDAGARGLLAAIQAQVSPVNWLATLQN